MAVPRAALPVEPLPRTELLKYAEAAAQLRVHPKTIRDWADEGRLVKVELGPQSLRVTAESVEALIARSVVSA